MGTDAMTIPSMRPSRLSSIPHTPLGSSLVGGLALQEFDLEIHIRPGRKNIDADALSKSPSESEGKLFGSGDVPEEDQEERDTQPLAKSQHDYPELKIMIDYLKVSILPEEETKAKEAVLSSNQYTLIDDVGIQIVAPKQQRKRLFEEAHSGCFGGHLRDGKVYGQLLKHYWWPKMRSDIIHWCRSCIICAKRRTGRREMPPLTPIPVMAPLIELALMSFSLPNHTKGTVTP